MLKDAPADVASWWERGGLTPPAGPVEVMGRDPVLPSPLRIGEAAAAALALVGGRVAELAAPAAPAATRVDVACAAASLLGFLQQRLDRPGPAIRGVDALTAFYRGGDGRWIHLHGGFPHLGDGLLRLLELSDDERRNASRVAAAVARWSAQDLEDAIAARRLCGAALRTSGEWAAHPQGRALAAEPTVAVDEVGGRAGEVASLRRVGLGSERPLAGLRVLDLTRVLAGPTCGRTLALFGADVLRVSAPRLPSIEPFVIDTGPGKRATFLDLAERDQAERLRSLVREADVVVCGYRSGALDRFGFGPDDLFALRPGLVVALVNAYGHTGPWASRGGWEQLAQTVSGVAAIQGSAERPELTPAAATDYTTGYLAAAGVLEALLRGRSDGASRRVRVSLCATAAWILSGGAGADAAAASGLGDLAARRIETETAWGRLSHLGPPLQVDGIRVGWDLPPAPLGTHPPRWLQRA